VKTTIKNATKTRDQIKANATLTRSKSRRIQWPQWNGVKKARREINKTTSKSYSIDLALYTLKEDTRSSSMLTFASLSNNVNWKKTKKKKDKQDEEDGDKEGTMGFQQPANRVNMIYGGDFFE
jgi:hypothetical protein